MNRPGASRQRTRRQRRTPAEWAKRGGLALAAAGFGYLSVTHSLAMVLEESAPDRAHALAPWDGRITARLAGQRFAEAQEAGADGRVAGLARLALRQDATAVGALSTLGLQAQLRGDAGAARRLLAYSQRLSRRDLQTQLWAIENAVARGDIAGALRHYDIALRTSKNAPDLLFPVLASAISDPAIRANLAVTLTRRPVWGPDFIAFSADGGTDPRAVADLFVSLRRRGVPVPDEARAELINKLIATGAIDAAWRLYAAAHPGADRARSRDPQFRSDLSTPSDFDWIPISDAGVSTSIQRGARGGVVDFSAPPSVGGPVLRQLQVLPAGSYRIEGHSVGIEQDDRALPYWMLTCPDGRELGRVTVPASARASGAFAGAFQVPAGCPYQTLTMALHPSNDIAGVSGQIDRVQLEPAR